MHTKYIFNIENIIKYHFTNMIFVTVNQEIHKSDIILIWQLISFERIINIYVIL